MYCSIKKKKPNGLVSLDERWWERQLRFVCLVYGRIVPRLNDQQLDSIAKDVLLLSGEPEVWRIVGVAREVEVLLQRVAKCLRRSALLNLAPAILELPVAEDMKANFSGLPTRNWLDPLSQFDSSEDWHGGKDLSKEVGPIIEQIATVSGEHRRILVLRVVSLWQRDLLNHESQCAFRDALFSQLDKNGFPSDTACYHSIVLGLPKQSNLDETKLYQRAYVAEMQPADIDFWANLARSVERENDHCIQRRSIRWSAKDLESLVSRTSDWAKQIRMALSRDTKPNSFARAFMGSNVKDCQQAVREWLHFIGEAVVRSSHFKGKLRKATMSAIRCVEESEICTVRLVPFLQSKEAIEPHVAQTRIRDAFTSDDEFVSWQACSAIVQWGKLVTSNEIEWKPGLESILGTSILLQYEKRIVLCLTAARELLEVYPALDSPMFFEDILKGMRQLLIDTAYSSDSSWKFEDRIRIRIECAKLAQQLRKMGHQAPFLQEFLESARTDCFAEVRRTILN